MTMKTYALLSDITPNRGTVVRIARFRDDLEGTAKELASWGVDGDSRIIEVCDDVELGERLAYCDENPPRVPHVIVDGDTLSCVLDTMEIDTVRDAGRMTAALDVIADALRAHSSAITTEVDARTSGRRDDSSEVVNLMDAVLVGQVDELRDAIFALVEIDSHCSECGRAAIWSRDENEHAFCPDHPDARING
jgi:hypothetical protein